MERIEMPPIVNYNNKRVRKDSVYIDTKCLICGRDGLLQWYKIQFDMIDTYRLNPDHCWKMLVCNHFREGQSKDRNDFCRYEKKFGRKAIKKARFNEIKTSYHIIGSELPKLRT